MGVSASAISRVTGVEVTPKNFNKGNASMLPQRLVIVGQGNDDAVYSLDKYECDGSAASVAERFGYGSPLHLAAKQLYPTAGSMATFPVTILPVKKGDNFVAAKGSLTLTGEAASAASRLTVSVGGLDILVTVAKGATLEEINESIVRTINSEIDRCVTAALVPGVDDDPAVIELTARWSGSLGNRIGLSVTGDIPGIAITVAPFADGAGVPAVDSALAKIGEIWETFILDTFDYKDGESPSALLDVYEEWGEGAWDVLAKRGALVAHGCTDDYETRTAITDARPTDRINFLIESVGAPELPFVVGARGLLDILTTADKNPAQNYKGTLKGLKRGSDAAQESYVVRNQAVMKGASTSIPNGSVAELNDVVTFYHPTSAGKYPAWRYVVDAVKLMNIVYNLRLITESDEVKGAPLVPDEQVTTNPTAVQPKMFKTWFANLAVSLGEAALISDVEFTIENLEVKIDTENSKRINYIFPVKISGNVEVISGDVYFGQYLG